MREGISFKPRAMKNIKRPPDSVGFIYFMFVCLCKRVFFRPPRLVGLVILTAWFGILVYGLAWLDALLFLDSANKQSVPKDEVLLPGFKFPQPLAVRPINDVLKNDWVMALKTLVNSMSRTREISLVTSNLAYRDVLLNWLVSATVRCHIPIQTIIVIALDEALYSLLKEKEINSVYVPQSAILDPDARFCEEFEKVMMTRLAIVRLLNHWGLDVANYDIDAILLKDPHPLYDSYKAYDIVGSVGVIPEDLFEEWGVTICIGVVLFRSTLTVEDYWNGMGDVCRKSFDDQEKLNCGLKRLNIKWQGSKNKHSNIVTGLTKNGLEVVILPYSYICRLESCTPHQRDTLYIWHKGGSRNKKTKQSEAQYGNTWFLKHGWHMLPKLELVTGVHWLQSISYWSVTHS